MKKNYIWWVLIVIVIAVCAYLGYVYWFNKPINFVTISINPEVELAVDSNNKVTEVVPINEDADVLTSDLNLVGNTVEEASDKIVDAAIETGYIDEYSDENTVVVTSVSDDENVRKSLEKKVMGRLNSHFEERNVYPVVVAKGLDDELKTEAKNYNVSYGKMLLIDRAVTLNPDLKKADLAKMSIQQIQKEIQKVVRARHDMLANAKQEWQQEKAKLKAAYVAKVQALKDSISTELKDKLKNMTTAEKQQAIADALKAKKEAIKAKVNEIKTELKNEVTEGLQNSNYTIINNKTDAIKANIKERIRNYKSNK